MADQMVGDFAQMLGGEHRISELVQRVAVHGFDGVDQLVKADGIGDGSRIGHSVNCRLTKTDGQPGVDVRRYSCLVHRKRCGVVRLWDDRKAMKLLLMLASLAAMVGAAAPAYADGVDDTFLATLRAAGIAFPAP